MVDEAYRYELREDGLAYWVNPHFPSKSGLDKVAILYDNEDSCVLKHGSLVWVNSRLQEIRSKLTANLATAHLFWDLRIIEIPATKENIEAVNRMLDYSNQSSAILRRLIEHPSPQSEAAAYTEAMPGDSR